MSNLKPLATVDPDLAAIIEKEKQRQRNGLELIASENFTSWAVMECLGSCLTNKYAEGEVGARYYGGSEHVDAVESLAKQRSLAAFKLSPDVWGLNVQPYSGSPANLEVYVGLLRPHDRIMGLALPCGGHLTHGFYTAKRRISATSIFFESMPYHTDETGHIDYAEMESVAKIFRPAMIILGASAYVHDYDYARVRALCDTLGCLMMVDMAHTAGLIAAQLLRSPFEFADVVTTTTHKSLRGPRSGVIFFRKVGRDGKPTDFESRINQAVFPGLQGGPHMHQIAAIATQMREVNSPEWITYATQVQTNARALATAMLSLGHVLVGGGTENHIVLWNVRAAGLTGAQMEAVLEEASITVNKNTIPGDTSALNPGGVRLGSCALTSRCFTESDMATVANFLDRALKIACALDKSSKDAFLRDVKSNGAIAALKTEVMTFAARFPMPGPQ